MSEQYISAVETSPRGSLKEWAKTLSDTEIRDIDILVSSYGYSGKGAAELLLLNQKGVDALIGLTQIDKAPVQYIGSIDELRAVERSQALHAKKLELKQQLEESLTIASDKLYDYSDAEISNFEKEAETLFAYPIEYKKAA